MQSHDSIEWKYAAKDNKYPTVKIYVVKNTIKYMYIKFFLMMMIRVIPICFIDSLMRTFNTFRADEIEDEK